MHGWLWNGSLCCLWLLTGVGGWLMRNVWWHPQKILLTSSSPLGAIKTVAFGLTKKISSQQELREIMRTPEHIDGVIIKIILFMFIASWNSKLLAHKTQQQIWLMMLTWHFCRPWWTHSTQSWLSDYKIQQSTTCLLDASPPNVCKEVLTIIYVTNLNYIHDSCSKTGGVSRAQTSYAHHASTFSFIN